MCCPAGGEGDNQCEDDDGDVDDDDADDEQGECHNCYMKMTMMRRPG